MDKPEPQQEHRWLERLTGEWTWESRLSTEPGKPEERYTGTETVRSLGGLWVVAEGRGGSPGGDVATMVMTLGYDPQAKRFVGTFIGSTMPYLWVYEGGELDAEARTLTLAATGPSMTGDGGMTKYRDVIELRSDDLRLLTGWYLDGDGAWQRLTSTEYRRRR